MEGIGDTIQALEALGQDPVCSSICRLDAERNPELVNAEFSINADADQVPVAINYLVP